MEYEFVRMDASNAADYAAVNTRCWAESYAGLLDERFLRAFDSAEERGRMTDALLRGLNDGSGRYLLRGPDGYLGLFRVRAPKYEGFEGYGELGALYLLDRAKKTGCGLLLFARAAEELRRMGYSKMVVGCLEGNPSNGFYLHLGGVFLKKNPITIGARQLNECLYPFDPI